MQTGVAVDAPKLSRYTVWFIKVVKVDCIRSEVRKDSYKLDAAVGWMRWMRRDLHWKLTCLNFRREQRFLQGKYCEQWQRKSWNHPQRARLQITCIIEREIVFLMVESVFFIVLFLEITYLLICNYTVRFLVKVLYSTLFENWFWRVEFESKILALIFV